MTKEEADEHLVSRAEDYIQQVLKKLEEDTGRKIEQVSVDMRNFVRLKVEIFLAE